jgi:hypothetical protein
MSSGRDLENAPQTQPAAGASGAEREQPDAPATPATSIPISIDMSQSSEHSNTAPEPSARPTLKDAFPARVSADTLLSAPAPADAADVELEERLTQIDRRLAALEEEMRELRAAPQAVIPSQNRWLIWLVLLLVLAASWPLLDLLK